MFAGLPFIIKNHKQKMHFILLKCECCNIFTELCNTLQTGVMEICKIKNLLN